MKTEKILIRDVVRIGVGRRSSLGWLMVSGPLIENSGAGEPDPGTIKTADRLIEGGGNTLMPGFIDLHTHGVMGHEFMEPDTNIWKRLSRDYATHGVTGLLASTWTASDKATSLVLETARNMMGTEEGAKILGVHLEGPYLNRSRAGAQDPLLIRTANRGEALKYLDTGLVKLVALAPEIEENQWLIRECVSRGITVSAGHTDASYEEMLVAADMGITQVTHCFNAMRPLNHRQPGTVGAALVLPQIRCELIADNIHIHPAVMKLLAMAKGLDCVILVTDSILGTGLPDGEILLEGQRVVLQNGAARLLDGTLAGSLLTMERGLRNFIQAVEIPLEQAWVCSSFNAARAIHIEQHKGSLKIGMDADLVMLNDHFDVQMTFVEGRIVFQAET